MIKPSISLNSNIYIATHLNLSQSLIHAGFSSKGIDSLSTEQIKDLFDALYNDRVSLDLSKSKLNAQDLMLISSLALNLKSLDLSYNTTFDALALDFLPIWLEKLSLVDCTQINEKDFEKLSRLKNLKELLLPGKYLKTQTFEALKDLCDLHSLIFSINDSLTDTQLYSLARASKTDWKKLPNYTFTTPSKICLPQISEEAELSLDRNIQISAETVNQIMNEAVNLKFVPHLQRSKN